MERNMKANITRLFTVLFAAVIITMSFSTMTVNAAGGYGSSSYNYELEDVNGLGATVTVKSNMVKVKKNNAPQVVKPSKVVVNGVTLKLNKNYTLMYQRYSESRGWSVVDSLTEPGLYRVCVVGIGGYKGITTKRIYVYDPKDGERCTPVSSWKIAVNKVPYTGEPITEGVIKSVKYKNYVLTEGEDYTVRYLNNVNSGTGTVRITAIEGMGFVGERDVNFQITGGTKINKAKVTGIVAKTYDYGNAIEQDMSQVIVMVGKNELVYGVDYDVAYYMNNTKVGTAKIIINGKGRYNGSITKTFKINKITLNSDMLDDASRSIVAEYTKKAIKPEVTLYNSNGEQLVKNTDYTLAYKNNVKKSEKAVITIKGKGNYAGSFNVNFKIVDKIEEEKPVEPVKPVKPEKPEVPGTGDGEESKGDETTETGETTGDENKDDKTGETGETTGEESKGDESVTPIQKPIGFRICDCQTIMPSYTYGLSDIEKNTWSNHMFEHLENGWQASYSSASYDKALKYKIIKENADGSWTLLQGTLLLPSESKVEETQTEEPAGEESKGDETSETGETTGEESKGDESVTLVQKPIGFRACDCGAVMPVYTYGLSDIEKKTWSDHLYEHNKDGWTPTYTTVSYDKALKYKSIKEDANGNWTLLQGTLLLPSESKVEEPEGGETTETGKTTSEESKGDETAETGETTGEESKGNESATPVQKPIGFNSCDCGIIMPIYTYGLSDIELKTWSDHIHQHSLEGWQAHYNGVSYERALKSKVIKEDENGNWILLRGTLLLPSESKVEETQTEGNVTEETATTEETQTEEPKVEETEVAEVDPNKLVGLRECWCGCELEIYGRGLTKSEESFWKDHMNCHARNGESTDYTETYF